MAMALKASFFKCAQSKGLGGGACMQQTLRCLEVYRLFSTASANVSSSQINTMKIFCNHIFYKGKSALCISPGKPVFKINEVGITNLHREGSMYMSFAPSTAHHQYDWSRKQVFALSAVELGGLVGLTTSDNFELIHDPHLGSSNAGMVRKMLKVEGMADKSGFFFSLLISNKLENVDERFSVPVTKAEFAVMRSAFNFIIPYLIGWHAHTNAALIQAEIGDGEVNPELEWAK